MDKIIELARKPAAKIVTRLILYGLTAIFAKLGMDSAQASEPAAAIGESTVTLAFLILASAIDKQHHKADTEGERK